MVQEVLQRKRESWSWGALWLAIGSWQWPTESNHWSWSVTTTGEFAEELNINHSRVICHLNQIEKVKKLEKWVPHELPENLQNASFWSAIFSYSTKQQTISQLDCDVWQKKKKIDFIQQLWMTNSVVGWRRSSKAFPKAKRAPKKGHGHCLVACCQSDPLQLSEFQ